MDIPYCACLKCGCVYFPSQRLCTYQAAVIPNRPLYLTSSLLPSLFCLSLPFLYVFSLQLCVLASCWRVKSEWGVVCNAYETAQREKQHKNFSICSNICFSFNVKLFSLQLYFLCSFILKVKFQIVPINSAEGMLCSTSKQNSPVFSSGLFDAPPFLTKLHPKFNRFSPFLLLILPFFWLLFPFLPLCLSLSFSVFSIPIVTSFLCNSSFLQIVFLSCPSFTPLSSQSVFCCTDSTGMYE